MKQASLFSGIGGFDLAAEWMGWENVFHCEWKEFNQKILKYYWPNATSYGDITKTDFRAHRGTIDILTGGFPCQPYSLSGKRKGKEDDRHLWPEMLRAIREIQPPWVVGENVRGLVSWNGGLVFEEVQAEMEAEGYEVQPFLLPAGAVGAPHKRDRIWFVAYSARFNGRCNGSDRKNKAQEWKNIFLNNSGHGVERSTSDANCNKCETGDELHKQQRRASFANGGGDASNADCINGDISGPRTSEIPQFEKANILVDNVTYPNSIRFQRGRNSGELRKERERGDERFKNMGSVSGSVWENFPTQSPICFGDDGLSSQLDGITFPKWRSESIMGAGNAIVPQVAFAIFQAINQYENLKSQ